MAHEKGRSHLAIHQKRGRKKRGRIDLETALFSMRKRGTGGVEPDGRIRREKKEGNARHSSDMEVEDSRL